MARSVFSDDAAAPLVAIAVRNILGAPVPGAKVTVRSSGQLADLFSDPDLTAAKTNPLTANGEGVVTYYAADGTYTHTATGASGIAGIEDVVVGGGGGISAALAKATYAARDFDWQTGKTYAAGDLAVDSDTIYRAVDNHTAGATFAGDQAAHWVAVSAASGFDPTAPETISGAWDFTGGVTADGVALATADDLGNMQGQAKGACVESNGLYPGRPSGFAQVEFTGVDNPNALGAPTLNAPTTATTGGTLAAATYYYKITATRSAGVVGETTPSAEQSVVTTGSTSTVTLTWAAVTGASGYKIYRGTAAGQEVLTHTVTSGATTTYTDAGDAAGADTPPASDTTGIMQQYDTWVDLS